MTPTQNQINAAYQRLSKFLNGWAGMRGMDQECIHSLNGGHDGLSPHGASILVEDLKTACSVLQAMQAPTDDERQRALELAKEALECSQPIMLHYPEPVERHAIALKSVSAAISIMKETL